MSDRDSDVRRRIIERAEANAKAERAERSRLHDDHHTEDNRKRKRPPQERTRDNSISGVEIVFPRVLLVIISWNAIAWGGIYIIDSIREQNGDWWHGVVLPLLLIPLAVVILLIHYIWVNMYAKNYWLLSTIAWLVVSLGTAWAAVGVFMKWFELPF